MNERVFRNMEDALRDARKEAVRVPGVATMTPPKRPGGSASAYAPPAPPSPSQLASITVQSVGKIGDASADEIEKVRAQLKRGWEEIDAQLEQLAEAFRGHARIAEQHISEFCLQATDFFESISAAKRKLQGAAPDRRAEEAEPKVTDVPEDPPPEFLTRGRP